jgi:hypothetical protein
MIMPYFANHPVWFAVHITCGLIWYCPGGAAVGGECFYFVKVCQIIGENLIFGFVINFTRLVEGNSLQSKVSGLAARSACPGG